MKKYMFVIDIKPEFEKEYIDIHLNPWKEMLEAIRHAGYVNEVMFYYKNQSIIYLECPEDKTNEECNAKLRATDVCKKWDITVNKWFANEPIMCKKIFDLNQQIDGILKVDQK